MALVTEDQVELQVSNGLKTSVSIMSMATKSHPMSRAPKEKITEKSFSRTVSFERSKD